MTTSRERAVKTEMAKLQVDHPLAQVARRVRVKQVVDWKRQGAQRRYSTVEQSEEHTKPLKLVISFLADIYCHIVGHCRFNSSVMSVHEAVKVYDKSVYAIQSSKFIKPNKRVCSVLRINFQNNWQFG